MKSIQYINFPNDCSIYFPSYKSVSNFKCKNKSVIYNGTEYLIQFKANKELVFLKRVGLIFLRILTAFILPVYSKSIEKVVKRNKENLYFAIPATYNQNKKIDQILSKGWQPSSCSETTSQAKMWDNSLKAVHEHSGKEGYAVYQKPQAQGHHFLIEAFINLGRCLNQAVSDMHFDYEAVDRKTPFENVLPALDSLEFNPKTTSPSRPLVFSHSAAYSQGARPTREDAYFYKEISQGVLSGVFKSHGGKEIAEYANGIFQSRFEKTLLASRNNVKIAFENLFHEIQTEVAKADQLKYRGSTAVVSFIDKKTNIIYTATLGDSEANIYRVVDSQMKSIPLSCVRNWASKKDAARAAKAKGCSEVAHEWPNIDNPKKLLFPYDDQGVNVSRAFGDIYAGYELKGAGMTHKPKITMNVMRPGDVLVLACDGLKDYMPEKAIAAGIASNINSYFKNLASMLVSSARKEYDSPDNISVMVIKEVHGS